MNVKEQMKALGDAKNSGFTVKFWRDTRESACKGSGVAKALDAMVGLGMAKNGSLKNVPDEKLRAAILGYRNVLSGAFKQALRSDAKITSRC